MSNDRDWQHPAEHAAENNHGFIMNPPPLAKRIVALTAIVSVLSSFAILFVAIPKGIDEYVDGADIATTIPIVKGAMPSLLTTLSAGGTTSCAVAVGNDVWVASSDGLNSATSATITSPDGKATAVRLYRSPSIPYLVVASPRSIDRSTVNPVGIAVDTTPLDLSSSTVVDCIHQESMTVQRTPSQFSDKNEVPVYVSGEVHGMAVVLNSAQSVIGLVFEHQHAEKLVLSSTLAELLATAE